MGAQTPSEPIPWPQSRVHSTQFRKSRACPDGKTPYHAESKTASKYLASVQEWVARRKTRGRRRHPRPWYRIQVPVSTGARDRL